ncbi:MAG: glucosyltransferase domain-containing protein, partial [Butyrivibrio sp.]|nr:glucosyltransferase domain-containing protein [Butyrivibrio sp.]
IVAASPLALNPCFLECLTYKFEAPYMALSVLFGFLPFLFFHGSTILYAGTSVFFTLCICLSYQTSVCIYPMMTAFLILTEWDRGRDRGCLLRRVLVSVSAFLAGLLLFKVLVLDRPSFLNVPGILPFREMIPGYIGNMQRYFHLLLTWQPKLWILLSGLLAASALFLFVKNTAGNRVAAALLFAACLAVMLAVSFGAFAFVREPQYLPRSMYGTGILCAILSAYVASLKPDVYAWCGRGVCILLAWCFFVFAFQYGNALAEQKRYIDFRIQLVMNDLINTDVMRTEGEKYFQLSGTAGNADMLDKMNYDMVRVLTQIRFGEGDGWGTIYFKEYFDLESTANLKLADIGTDLTRMELPLLADTPYHRIYGAFPYILIELLP